MKSLLACIVVCAAQSAFAIGPLSAINLANPAIVDWKIVGACKFTPRIQHWIPVAWGETSPRGDGGFISGISAEEGKTGAIRASGLESTLSARVFNFSEKLWRMSAIAMSHAQGMCSIQNAHVPSLIDLSLGAADCDNALVIKAAIKRAEVLSQATLLDLMSLAYDSGEDSGWTSGCRDKDRVDEAVAANARCTNDALGAGLQSNGLKATAVAARNCVGNWGSIIPRQARELGLTGPAASVKTLMRAMSTARDHLGQIDYPVDTDGKFQMAKPSRSDGFHAGTLPLPANVTPTADRRYAWIYWRKVSCCLGF